MLQSAAPGVNTPKGTPTGVRLLHASRFGLCVFLIGLPLAVVLLLMDSVPGFTPASLRDLNFHELFMRLFAGFQFAFFGEVTTFSRSSDKYVLFRSQILILSLFLCSSLVADVRSFQQGDITTLAALWALAALPSINLVLSTYSALSQSDAVSRINR